MTFGVGARRAPLLPSAGLPYFLPAAGRKFTAQIRHKAKKMGHANA
jgi:hypothetical protein